MCLATSNKLFHAFFPRTFSLPRNDVKTFFFNLHHLSPVIFANTTVVAFLLLRRSSVNQPLLRNRPGSGSYDLSRLLARKITKSIHSCKPASLNRPIVHLNNHYHHHITYAFNIPHCKIFSDCKDWCDEGFPDGIYWIRPSATKAAFRVKCAMHYKRTYLMMHGHRASNFYRGWNEYT